MGGRTFAPVRPLVRPPFAPLVRPPRSPPRPRGVTGTVLGPRAHMPTLYIPSLYALLDCSSTHTEDLSEIISAPPTGAHEWGDVRPPFAPRSPGRTFRRSPPVRPPRSPPLISLPWLGRIVAHDMPHLFSRSPCWLDQSTTPLTIALARTRTPTQRGRTKKREEPGCRPAPLMELADPKHQHAPP